MKSWIKERWRNLLGVGASFLGGIAAGEAIDWQSLLIAVVPFLF